MESLIVVPHRGLAAAKTRLAGRLSADERAALARRLLERVLRVVRDAERGDVLVISPDAGLSELTDAAGARLVVQRGLGLNAGAEEARRLALAEGVALVAVLHGDLPRLGADDVRSLVDAVPAPRGVVIAPDQTLAGTNALAMRPADAIPFRFGPGSFEAHLAAARAAAAPPAVVERPGLAFDLDTPADLDRLLAEDAVR